MKPLKQEKVCAQCGRSFEWRKKWEKNWSEIKYCSDRCRGLSRDQGKAESLSFQKQIMDLLKLRATGKTICPSEILQASQKQDLQKMEQVRQAARLLAHNGLIEITQSGKNVDPDSFQGPIRLRLK